MSAQITVETIAAYRQQLDTHPIYSAIDSLDALRCFMQHHVYSVWDFMSLIKYLQSVVAPAAYPWDAQGDGDVRRFINELVLEEESDAHPQTGAFTSHFALYREAMREVGADDSAIGEFVAQVRRRGIDAALDDTRVPAPSRRFTRTTFDIIASDRPHAVAAALALGREHIIPGMFRTLLARFAIEHDQAPVFHAYLQRHVHLDADFHAPMSLRLLNNLCAGDEARIAEAIATAQYAVDARLALWDGVLAAITARRAA